MNIFRRKCIIINRYNTPKTNLSSINYAPTTQNKSYVSLWNLIKAKKISEI